MRKQLNIIILSLMLMTSVTLVALADDIYLPIINNGSNGNIAATLVSTPVDNNSPTEESESLEGDITATATFIVNSTSAPTVVATATAIAVPTTTATTTTPSVETETAVPTEVPTAVPVVTPDMTYLGSYVIEDTGFGTQVNVVVDDEAKTRSIVSNALPNHETGEFPNDGNPNTISAQNKTWSFTTEPTFVGTATFAMEPGVAINGVKFEPDTAERATCESGEVHSIEAIQTVTDLGLDFNNAHVQPTGEYHYHGVSNLLIELYSSDQDLIHVAFAADGHLIYYSKSGAYQPSYRLGEGAREGTNCTYTPGAPGSETIAFGSEKDGSLKSDWDYSASDGQLDECNGITIDGQYIYLITNDYPYIPRCLMGEFTASGPGGGGPPPSGGPPGGSDDATATATNVAVAATPASTASANPTAMPTTTSTNFGGSGLNTSLFFDGALAEDISTQDCTLSDGTETTCYAIMIAGYPANHEVGPFCPETTSDKADNSGIWFDGIGVYDLDGPFILSLAELYNDSNWKLYDDDGNVNITDTGEAFEAAARPDVDPAYQNHCVEGRIEWLDNGEPVPTTVLIPITPVDGASATQANGNLGVTLNGVIMAAPAPVDAILSAYTIAAFDDCGGHINPVDGYHLHGARGCSEVGEAADGETPIFAYALDGYPIHSPLDEAAEAMAGLDACQGHTTETDGYHYHAASAEKNAILSCFTGATAQTTGQGGGNGAPGDGGPDGGAPDFAAATILGVTEQELRDALGGPPPDLEAAAETLGVTVEALESALNGEAIRTDEGVTPPTTTVAATATTMVPTSTIMPPATNTATLTSMPTTTDTATSTAMPPPATRTNTATSTAMPTMADTATSTAMPPPATRTNTATSTAMPTMVDTATSTAMPPPATRTNTATSTAMPTIADTVTSTGMPPATDTATSIPTATDTSTVVPTATDTATNTATATSTATTAATDTTTPTATSTPEVENWLSAWMMNTTGETSAVFTGETVNVSSTYTKMLNGKEYQCITASGIPNYETVMTQDIIDSLNERPRVSVEFATGGTTSAVGQVIAFGGDVGYTPAQGCSSGQDGYGYWPPGPACPSSQSKEQCFPLEPVPATTVCEVGMSSMGTWVNGVSIFNWSDGASYNSAGVWQNDAFHFEFYDLDICPGHSANGDYHHHSHPVCLQEQLGDGGTEHSPIYGFAADGYPIYGPWHDNGVLAQSCWKTRDYDDPTSVTGCGTAGERSCLLVDEFDITKGIVAAGSNGPTTSDVVSSLSSNTFVATSGYYYEDYYYDSSCTAQGGHYLDEHNGHDHDALGYHYHISRAAVGDGTYEDVFPYYVGPTYAGTLQDDAIASCSTGAGGGPGGGGPPTGPPTGPPPGGGPLLGNLSN